MHHLDGKDQNGVAYQKEYYISTFIKETWINARKICQSYGFDLITFDTEEELNAFSPFYRNENETLTDYSHVGGFTYDVDSSIWFWVTNEKEIGFKLKFAPLEPNNIGGLENCLALWKYSEELLFNDFPCSEYYFATFFCEGRKIIPCEKQD